MSVPVVVITGSSGFVGRHLIEAFADRFRLVGVARRSQQRCGVAPHPNLTWFQADIGELPQIADVFHRIASIGPIDTVIHLAAHYDFTGEDSPEYWRTNVEGLRHVVHLSAALQVKRFIFSSSVAACPFPGPGEAIDETTPPHGDHIYARTKRAGEEMLAEYRERFQTVIVRFAALFSDWCEYPPLYMFLETWLGDSWNRRILGGHGRSAIPYLHVADLVLFFEQLLDQIDEIDSGEILVASPDGCVSHRQLYEAATLAFHGSRDTPVFMPRVLCGPGMAARDMAGRLTGARPFERPWMARYIDREMRIDASRTRTRLGWSARPRLAVLRRLPFLVENMKTDPVEWHRRNREAMKIVSVPTNLKVHWLLQAHEDDIIREFNELLTDHRARARFASYQEFTPEQHDWHHRVILRHLMNAVRTRERGIFMAYCRDLARQRLSQGFAANELCGALEGLNLVCFRVLRRDPAANDLRQGIYDYVTATLKAGCDQAQEVFELGEARQRAEARRREHERAATPAGRS